MCLLYLVWMTVGDSFSHCARAGKYFEKDSRGYDMKEGLFRILFKLC